MSKKEIKSPLENKSLSIGGYTVSMANKKREPAADPEPVKVQEEQPKPKPKPEPPADPGTKPAADPEGKRQKAEKAEETKSAHMHILIRPSTKAELKRRADAAGISVNDLINKILEENTKTERTAKE